MSTDFQVFDEDQTNMLSNSAYSADSGRQAGVDTGIASGPLYNKFARQTSTMVAAFGQYMSDQGQNVSDSDFSALLTSIATVFAPASEATGVGKDFWGLAASVPSGWILADGKTIGSGSSGATGRANSDTSSLFSLLWLATDNTNNPIQTSAGSPTTRGVSAAADFAANKRLPLPDTRGRGRVGLDNMGGTAASRITSASTGGANSTAIMGAGGLQTDTLSGSTVPTLTGTAATGGTHTHVATTADNGLHTHVATVDSGGTHTHTASTNTTGAHTHNVIFDYNRGDSGSLGKGVNIDATGETDTTSSNGDHSHTVTINTTNSAHSHTSTNANNGLHNHTVTVTTTNSAHAHDVTVNPGGGAAHNNTQPWIACNYIIKL